jgi:hypothetical protein
MVITLARRLRTCKALSVETSAGTVRSRFARLARRAYRRLEAGQAIGSNPGCTWPNAAYRVSFGQTLPLLGKGGGEMLRLKTSRAILLVLVVAVATAIGAANVTQAHGEAAVERLPVTCYANILDGYLAVGVLTPDYPAYWDLVPPVGSYAGAMGVGVFTPSGQANIVCNDDGWTDGSAAWAPTLALRGTCFTGRGGDAFGHFARLYSGQATTVVNQGTVHVSCQLTFRGITN